MPYLTIAECEKFIADAATLLNSQGVLYISFVEGNYDDSGFKTGSTGDRTYFYFHNQKNMADKLHHNGFETLHVVNKNYIDSNGTAEIHCILIAQKIS